MSYFSLLHIIWVLSTPSTAPINNNFKLQESRLIRIYVGYETEKNTFDRNLFQLSERDSFSHLNLLLEGFNKSFYELPLNETKVFDVSYKKGFPLISFLGSPGDTVNLTIRGDSVCVTNSKHEIITLKDFNILNDKRNAVLSDKIESLLSKIINKRYITKGGFLIEKKPGISPLLYSPTRNHLVLLFHEQLKAELLFIDSLETKSLVSYDFANWLRLMTKGHKVWTLANLSIRFEGQARLSDFSEFNFLNDSLVFEPSGYYRSLLASVFLTGVVLKNNVLQLTKDFRGFNYKTGYDSSDNYVNGLNLEYLKFYCLSQMKTQTSSLDFKDYSDRYLSTVKNARLRFYVKENLIASTEISEAVKADLLLNKVNEKSRFSSLLERGRVIYVDFWASWCKPCREAMPQSKKLRAELAGMKIDFVYISIDTDKSHWLSANLQEGLDQFSDSYLLLDVKEAKLITENDLSSIPRYMIIDKNGKIANNSAPGPDSKITSELLIKLSN